ncbi:MAG TPA: FAD-binding protein [Longimicrobiales bacterium]|nr:FAD-binding protein [Longimicrobiales bacterium]
MDRPASANGTEDAPVSGRHRSQGDGRVGRGAGNGMVILSSARLAAVGSYDPADLVAGMQAGATLDAVEAALARNGQVLALDPPSAAGATIGAVAALDAAGPLRAGLGTPRDQVLGVELVSGDGRILRFGGQVVKNVAGYDVTRLVVGSAGVLGLITSLHIRVTARPAADRTVVLASGGAQDAAAVALACRDAVSPAALEVLGPDGTGSGWRVAVRVQGSADGVADALRRVRQLGAAVESDAQLWRRLTSSEGESPMTLRLAGRPGELADLLDAGSRFAARIFKSDSAFQGSSAVPVANAQARPAHGAAVRIAAHVTDGVVRVWVPTSAAGVAAPLSAETLREAGAELAAEAVTSGWTWRYDIMPGAVQTSRAGHPSAAPRRHASLDLLPADSVPEPRAAALMAQIRQAFDPAGILEQ